VKIHRRALRFLEELPRNRRRLVEERIRELVESLERGVLPYRRLDIRRLRGEWGAS
jgi:mRNA-degrading endonuclease RelE of RelBE toxin-antitoxin system